MMSVVLTGLQELEHFWLVLYQVNDIQASFIAEILVFKSITISGLIQCTDRPLRC